MAPRPAEAAPGLPPSPRPAAEAVPSASMWGERRWHPGIDPSLLPAIGEAEPWLSPAMGEALIRDLLPPGVPREAPPRGEGPRPETVWPGRPAGPQPMRQPLPLNRELLRRLLLTGGV
jgi:hypothetical protein